VRFTFARGDWPKNRNGGYVAAFIVSAVAAAGAAAESARASSQQAKAATQSANYNAKVDISNAQQVALDAQANIQKQRQDDQAYQSNQRAALAASGVDADSGSPMALQATTAGRQEQDIQTYWSSVQEKESSLYGAAEEGVVEGQEEADIYHLQGAGDIFQGVGSVAGAFGGAAKAGGWGGTPSPSVDSSASTNALF
jgi:hypothetical protein